MSYLLTNPKDMVSCDTAHLIGSEKGIHWKQGNHTRYEYTRFGFIESDHYESWLKLTPPSRSFNGSVYEPCHDKTNNMTVRPAKTQISLGIRPV